MPCDPQKGVCNPGNLPSRANDDDRVKGWFQEKLTGWDTPNFSGELSDLRNSFEQLVPRLNCASDYVLPVHIGNYDLSLHMPICNLSAKKEILEWMIYALTFLYLYNLAISIAYHDVRAYT
ncbi:hypothetical protein BROC_01300 [Candidatus Brocadiaceae bacterium]|nr:hypothetical protein BROC_01300 [Candidatus Brocadiaceae bacterium]